MIQKILLSLNYLVLISIFFSCDGGVEPTELRFDINLRIKDSVSHAPIKYVSIKINQSLVGWGVTNDTGYVHLEGVKSGNWNTFISSSMFESKTISLNLDKNLDTTFYLRPTSFPFDTVKPSVIGFIAGTYDCWLLFSERMDKESVEQATYVTWGGTSHNFISTWTLSNIYEISTPDSTKFRSVTINTNAKDFHGNFLRELFHYP